MVICVPSGITGVEQRAVQEVAEWAGARKPGVHHRGAHGRRHRRRVCLFTSRAGTWSSTSVAGLPKWRSSHWGVSSPASRYASAATRWTRPSSSSSRRSTAWLSAKRTAEEIKIAFGSACPLEEELYAEIGGRDLVTGLPKTIVTSTEEIREAIEEPVSAIVDAVTATLDKTPPELAADIMVQGIVLTGGGALLTGSTPAWPPRPA